MYANKSYNSGEGQSPLRDCRGDVICTCLLVPLLWLKLKKYLKLHVSEAYRASTANLLLQEGFLLMFRGIVGIFLSFSVLVEEKLS